MASMATSLVKHLSVHVLLPELLTPSTCFSSSLKFSTSESCLAMYVCMYIQVRIIIGHKGIDTIDSHLTLSTRMCSRVKKADVCSSV